MACARQLRTRVTAPIALVRGRKWETVRKEVLAPVKHQAGTKPASVGIIAIGSCDLGVREARSIMESRGITTDYLRIRAFPFSHDVSKFVDEHEHVFIVEQNRDAQLRSMINIDCGISNDRLSSVLSYDGMPITADFIVSSMTEQLRESRAA